MMTRLTLLASSALLAFSAAAYADDPPDASKPAATEPPAESGPASTPTSPPTTFANGINLSAQIEAGITGYPDANQHARVFGGLFTDHPNQAMLNQVLLTASKLVDPKATDFDWGFKVQGMYGSDARITHFVGELDKSTTDRNQLDIVEANVSLHLPILSEGGVDLKIGQYPTPIGAETIDPSTNSFYSHSYIFNFGIPLKHTGAYATWHATSVVDLWGGVDTGLQTSFGRDRGDNNGSAAGLAGIGLNLADGKLTVLALTHFGPENASKAVPKADDFFRYENDVVITFKPTDTLTFITEGNWIRDDAFNVNAFGVAEYAGYALNDQVTLNARAEGFRDDNGFFVGAFPGNLDFINAEEGNPATVLGTGKGTTYGALTFGVTWKPTVPAPIQSLSIRPEVRWDHTFTDNRAFNNFRDKDQVTIAGDFIIQF